MNAFKQALKQGKVQIGLWASFADPYPTEIVASAGFDWLALDCEHAPNDLRTVLAQLQAMAGTPAQPVVRRPDDGQEAVAEDDPEPRLGDRVALPGAARFPVGDTAP